MNRYTALTIFLINFLLICTGGNAFAEISKEIYSWKTGEVKITIDGTSTLHDWTMEGNKIIDHIEYTSTPHSIDDFKAVSTDNIKTFKVEIPIGSLDSDSSTMTSIAREALKEEDHPHITFTLDSIAPSAEEQEADKVSYDANGKLSIAGVTKDCPLKVSVNLDNEELHVSTSKKLKMSDFGIEKPTAMLGMIKTGDDIEVGIKWTMKHNGALKPASPSPETEKATEEEEAE